MLPVRLFPSGQSPYDVLDAAGWGSERKATPARTGRYVVKSGFL